MRRFIALLSATLLVVGALELQAQPQSRRQAEINYTQSLGKVTSDSMKWMASGNIPGTGGIRTDTIVAGTLIDTTFPYNIAGASAVMIEFVSLSVEDDSDFTVTAQVATHSDTTAAWHSLNTTYSVDNTAGAQQGGSDNTGRDTTMWIMNPIAYSNAYSALVNPTGQTLNSQGDRFAVANSRFIRLIITPDSASGDTTLVHAVITRVFAR